MFFWAFVVYPILEVAAFVGVARATSASFAILLALSTSLLGFVILRLQRHGVLFASKELSQRAVSNYLFANLGALALIWPGFVSDLVGVVLLIPPLRKGLAYLLGLAKIDLTRSATGAFTIFRARGAARSDERQDASNPFETSGSYGTSRASSYESGAGRREIIVEREDKNQSEASEVEQDGGDWNDDVIDVEFTKNN